VNRAGSREDHWQVSGLSLGLGGRHDHWSRAGRIARRLTAFGALVGGRSRFRLPPRSGLTNAFRHRTLILQFTMR